MRWPRLRTFMPKSLFGRSLLIIVLPVAMMQIAVTYTFFDAHWTTVTSRLADGVAGDVAVVMDLYEQAPGPNRAEQLHPFTSRTMQIAMTLEPGEVLPSTVRSSFFRVLDRTLRRALASKLNHEFWFDTTRYPAYVEIRIQVDAGVLRLIVPRDRVFATTGHIFLFWIVVATLLLTAVSLIYIRNQARPIERLADAAERFGRGQDAPHFKPTGAREVRQAAQAFIDMRRRIKRQIDQRTTLLASVSHDLRTPLTRLKLQLAMMSREDEDINAMRADVEAMEMVLGEYLDFARGVASEEPEPADIGELVSEIVEQTARGGANVTAQIQSDADLVLSVRASALSRCMQNLISNAVAHADKVAVSARRENGAIFVDVEDDGPGIAEDQREEAFRPFARLDEARNANKGGVGLGLAIARDVARGHGGDITLSESEMGGLRARLRLPT